MPDPVRAAAEEMLRWVGRLELDGNVYQIPRPEHLQALRAALAADQEPKRVDVYVLLHHADFEGHTLAGVYSSLDLALAASKGFPPSRGDWPDIFRVQVDAPARYRFDPDEESTSS